MNWGGNRNPKDANDNFLDFCVDKDELTEFCQNVKERLEGEIVTFKKEIIYLESLETKKRKLTTHSTEYEPPVKKRKYEDPNLDSFLSSPGNRPKPDEITPQKLETQSPEYKSPAKVAHHFNTLIDEQIEVTPNKPSSQGSQESIEYKSPAKVSHHFNTLMSNDDPKLNIERDIDVESDTTEKSLCEDELTTYNPISEINAHHQVHRYDDIEFDDPIIGIEFSKHTCMMAVTFDYEVQIYDIGENKYALRDVVKTDMNSRFFSSKFVTSESDDSMHFDEKLAIIGEFEKDSGVHEDDIFFTDAGYSSDKVNGVGVVDVESRDIVKEREFCEICLYKFVSTDDSSKILDVFFFTDSSETSVTDSSETQITQNEAILVTEDGKLKKYVLDAFYKSILSSKEMGSILEDEDTDTKIHSVKKSQSFDFFIVCTSRSFIFIKNKTCEIYKTVNYKYDKVQFFQISTLKRTCKNGIYLSTVFKLYDDKEGDLGDLQLGLLKLSDVEDDLNLFHVFKENKINGIYKQFYDYVIFSEKNGIVRIKNCLTGKDVGHLVDFEKSQVVSLEVHRSKPFISLASKNKVVIYFQKT